MYDEKRRNTEEQKTKTITLQRVTNDSHSWLIFFIHQVNWGINLFRFNTFRSLGHCSSFWHDRRPLKPIRLFKKPFPDFYSALRPQTNCTGNSCPTTCQGWLTRITGSNILLILLVKKFNIEAKIIKSIETNKHPNCQYIRSRQTQKSPVDCEINGTNTDSQAWICFVFYIYKRWIWWAISP